MVSSALRTIAIVGAGFSGTATAIHLLRSPPQGVTRVVLIERAPEVGRGLAYARRDYPYLLNVPAARMSATSSDPDEFLHFARRRRPNASGEDFLPREFYGDYVRSLLDSAAAAARPSIRLEILRDSVIDIRCVTDGAAFRLTLAGAGALEADDVVLALGTPPPRLPAEAEAVRLQPGYVNDPWGERPYQRPPGPVLLIGSGLTMVDVASARLATEPGCEVHVLSRHGLLPLSQWEGAGAHANLDALDRRLSTSSSVRTIVRAVREAAEIAATNGGDWRELIMHVRRDVPELWQRMPVRERRRFLRHVRAYWEIHRHRLPHQVHAHVEALQASGRIKIHAGRLARIEAVGAGLCVTWRPRGRRALEQLRASAVVNCTGADFDVRNSTDPLWQSLLGQGLVCQDELRLGLRTGPRGEALDRAGQPSAGLYYVGPMLRATHWEATAVAELRGHAARLATHLAQPNR